MPRVRAGMHGDGIVMGTHRATWRVLLSALLPPVTAFACVISDAISGPEVAPVILRYSGDTVLIVGDSVAPDVIAQIGDTPVTRPRFRYTIEDSTIIALSAAADALVAKRPGITHLTASLVSTLTPDPSPSVTVTLEVVTNVPAFVDITRSVDTLTSLGDTLPVPVAILNARGDTLPPSSVEWWSDAPLVSSVTANGLVIARDTGETFVHARYERALGDTLRDSIRIRVLNVPASVVLSDARDTLTALGQSVDYTSEVRNARDNTIPGYPIGWSSTNPAVASVSPTGTVTAVGIGTALIIGRAGTLADTVVNVVLNPTRLVVDNAVIAGPRLGTFKRPYATIRDGVNAADADDTVFVRRGAAPYSETVALDRRVTLLGDDSAFAASVPRNPLLLPLISHDTGAAGITVHTTATVIIKHLALRHTIAGPAIDARHADLRVAGFYVNPPGTVAGRVGRGIALDSSGSSAASITDVDIRSVRGYGIRLRDATGVVVDGVTIETVDSIPGDEPGAGVRVLRGSGHTIRRAAIRGTQGPHIFIDSSPGSTLALNDLAGRQRLILVHASNGTTIRDNAFDTRPLGLNGEVVSAGSLLEWAALELEASAQVVVTNNTFRDAAGTDQEPFNGVRFIDVTNPAFPFQPGAQVVGNRFNGSRTGIRSERSYLSIQGSRFDSTLAGVLGTDRDVLVLQNDTVMTTLQGRCLTALGATYVTVTGTQFERCTAGAPYAVAVSGGFLNVQQSAFAGNRAAVSFTGSSFTAQGNIISGAGFTPAPSDTSVALAALDAVAQSVTILHNSITGHRYSAGVRIASPQASVRIDSNFVSGNIQGVRLGPLESLSARDNDIFDNDSTGVVNDAGNDLGMPQTWWGDPRGPRRGADVTATGDSVAGPVTVTGWTTTPHNPGGPSAALRSVRGDGQSAAAGTTLPRAFTVRVVDGAGRPVAGVSVTFRVTAGGSGARFVGANKELTVTSDPSGLAEATLTLGSTPGPNTVTATAPGLNSITFTATGT